MFETATFSYGPSPKRVWTTAMGFTGQAVLVGCALLAPLVSPQTLGRAYLVTGLVAPGVPPPVRRAGPADAPRPTRMAAVPTTPHTLVAPGFIPTTMPLPSDDPPEPAGNGPERPGVKGGTGEPGRGSGTDLALDIIRVVPVVRPPEVTHRETIAPVAPVKPPRITSVRMAIPIYRVEPIYPQLARQAHVSGVVELLGVLSTDGRIHELKVLRGHPLLVAAALDAVRQWIFEPTLLNGQAVEVSAPITVNFILKQ